MNNEFCKKTDMFLKEYCEKHRFSGSIRITKKDKIIYEKNIGYADWENRIDFTKKSVFAFYSLTKPFTAMGLMKLREKGLVDIKAHPSKYVPEAIGFDKRVTIEQMLRHTSGLPDFVQTAKFNEKYNSGTPEEIRKYLKELSEYPSVFEPGTQNMYANVNFIICALIIENISDLKYSEYMKKEIFQPLNMYTATVDFEGNNIDNRVTGYDLINEKYIPVRSDLNWMLGAGDIIGTVDDVYCLNKALKYKLILSEKTWEEILTPSPINSMGMGCTVSDWHEKKRITHNGGSRGFRTLHIWLPEDDFDIIILSNSGWGDARNDISEAVFEAYYGKDCILSEKIKMDAGYI